MEDSILKSTKTALGLAENYTAFDHEIILHINSTFSHLKQLGVGTAAPIDDAETKWEDLELPEDQLNMVKTFMFMKVKQAFDPPGTSFLLDTTEKLIREQEWRINAFVEENRVLPAQEEVEPV